MSRPLALHSSALSEREYTCYAAILAELLPSVGVPQSQGGLGQVDWDSQHFPFGEAKGWIRGKYGVDAAVLEQVCLILAIRTAKGGDS
ncbi:hypothetical protein FRC02_001712 [Tulasnella sp. 418]|nr:hypothetical protein FRC02_001712 [Tulasnella sp. 418]